MTTAKFYMSILLFLHFTINHAQILRETCQIIGNFQNASAFHINPQGSLYVIDQDKNEIIKMDTLGNIVKTIGGYGRNNLSFDSPEDIFTTTLNVYVADKNNDRIQIFDKDLNFLSSFYSSSIHNENTSFRYPSGVGLSNQGDFFILDSDNSRILKFSFNGTFLTTIGSYDAGSFALSNPVKFVLSSSEKILVIDQSQIVVFDSFGNNITKIALNFEPTNINSTANGITIISEDRIDYSLQPNSYNFNTFIPETKDVLRDALIFNSKMYVLTSTTIHIYKIIQ